jgi:hypothetical protein
MRFSLDNISKADVPVSYSYFCEVPPAVQLTFAPVQGTTDTLYWAALVQNNENRIYQ